MTNGKNDDKNVTEKQQAKHVKQMTNKWQTTDKLVASKWQTSDKLISGKQVANKWPTHDT